MEAAGDHPVPSGPLAVRWLAYDAGRPRAGALGTARLALQNAGTVPWPPTGERRVCLGYHWLDELGNPIVWDGLWTALPREVAPGERVEAELTVRGPLPPGPYRLPVDLLAQDRHWVSELGQADPRVRAPASLPVRRARGRAGLGRARRGPTRAARPDGRAVALRRAHPGHSSTAIWSSTRLKSQAPSTSEATAATHR